MSGFRVNSKQCETCIFGNRTPIPPERFAELAGIWRDENKAQRCHSNAPGGDVGCRGHLEAATRGEQAHPVFSAMAGLRIFEREAARQIAERLGFISFVKVDKETKE